jgi:YHS domain-containing protein
MAWLAQNWIWIILIVGFFFLMRRGGCGGGMNRQDRHGGDTQHSAEEDNPIAAVTDPVSNATLDTAVALTSVYRGKIYYFASAENRAIFEAKPEQYAGSDQPDPHQHKTHRHGC